jgi:hypothetical protein
MQYQFTHDTVRLMGVHVLAVYMLLSCAEQDGITPVKAQWILDHMPDKTSPNTVTAALRWLTSAERQIAVRVVGGWRLNRDNTFQLPLTYELPAGENLSQSENRAERDSEATTTTVKLRESKNKSNLTLTAVVEDGENRAQRESSQFTDDQKAIWRICKKIGVGEPTRSRIALETDLPPEYVWAHGLYGASEGMAVGLIIHRIRSRDWLPEHWKEASRGSIDQFFECENEDA